MAGQTRHPIGAAKHRKPPSPAGEQAAYQRSQALGPKHLIPSHPHDTDGSRPGSAHRPGCIATLNPRELYAGYTGFVLPLVTNSMKCSSQAGNVATSGNSGSGIARARMASRQ